MGFDVCLHYDPREESIRQWGYVLEHWRPRSTFVVAHDTPTGYPSATWLMDLIDLPNVSPWVYVTADKLRTELLPDFMHPERCVYIFGQDVGGALNIEADYKVHIPTDSDLQMFSYQAAVAVLYSRLAQRWQIK